MIVHLGNKWINIDVVVAHAPHSWDTKHQEGAEEATYVFGTTLKYGGPIRLDYIAVPNTWLGTF